MQIPPASLTRMLRERVFTCRSQVLIIAGREGRVLGALFTGRELANGVPGRLFPVPARWRPLYVRAFERAARNR
jgi:hypothetical protein